MNSVGTVTIETDRLILRKFNFTDAEDMLKFWVSKPEVQHMYAEPVYSTLTQVNELLQKYTDGYKSDDYFRWAIIDKATDCCMGQIAYYIVDTKNNFAEIEYCIGTDFQKKGFMTEAVKAVIKFGFEETKLHRIQISTKSINTPSRKVIEKCGFKHEGTFRDYFYFDGTYVDRVYFSMLDTEYEITE